MHVSSLNLVHSSTDIRDERRVMTHQGPGEGTAAHWKVSERPGEWFQYLDAAMAPRLMPMRVGGPLVWRISLGHLEPWPHPIDRVRHRKLLYGKQSAALVHNGLPWAAEVEIARRLRAGGWFARWLLKYEEPPEHFQPYVAMDKRGDRSLPEQVMKLVGTLGRSGAPDVVAWRPNADGLRIVGLESKRVGKNADRIGPKQVEWYREALVAGLLAHEDLAVVEWCNDRPTASHRE